MTTGVIVGRFQVNDLHDGHFNLITHAISKCDRVIIFIGVTPDQRPDHNNPLNFDQRRIMINRVFPGIIILPIYDMESDKDWSNQLDGQIDYLCKGEKVVILFGGPDSFINRYSGKHAHNYEEYITTFTNGTATDTGTSIRNRIAWHPNHCDDFREGIIYSEVTRPAHVNMTVDIAVIDNDQENSMILLGRKKHDPEGLYRFPGGFVDVQDYSLEGAAMRELAEETGMLADSTIGLMYIGSLIVDDWRYRKRASKIMTSLFTCRYNSMSVAANDDLDSLKWHRLDVVQTSPTAVLVPTHVPIAQVLDSYLKNGYPARGFSGGSQWRAPELDLLK